MPVGRCAEFDNELVERYSLGRLTEDECAAFEEHFLACEACQARLQASDAYVMAVKAAGAQLVRRKPARATAVRGTLAAADRV
jgi:anti-sigma factor RsiW